MPPLYSLSPFAPLSPLTPPSPYKLFATFNAFYREKWWQMKKRFSYRCEKNINRTKDPRKGWKGVINYFVCIEEKVFGSRRWKIFKIFPRSNGRQNLIIFSQQSTAFIGHKFPWNASVTIATLSALSVTFVCSTNFRIILRSTFRLSISLTPAVKTRKSVIHIRKFLILFMPRKEKVSDQMCMKMIIFRVALKWEKFIR